jgi:hypothetical protein
MFIMPSGCVVMGKAANIWGAYIASLFMVQITMWVTTVFQAELYAIKACVAQNQDSNYRKRNIYILSVKLKLKLLATTSASQNWSGTVINPSSKWLNITVHMIWVLGYEGIAGNEIAD